MTHYSTMVKNWVMQLEKGWKKAKKTLGLIEAKLFYENDVYEDSYIITK